LKWALSDGADYVMILNSDTIVDPNIIERLLSALESDERIGAVAPKIYFAKGHEFHKVRYKQAELGKVFWFAGGYMDWDNVKSVHRGVDEVDNGQYDKVEKIDFASGCCVMFKRKTLEKVGLFDEKYFLYFEDADLSQRIQRAGYALYFAPEAVVWHFNAASSGGAGNNLQDYFITRNRMLFGMIYAPLRAKLALIRESSRLLLAGRPYQKKAIKDFYLARFGKGTYFNG